MKLNEHSCPLFAFAIYRADYGLLHGAIVRSASKFLTHSSLDPPEPSIAGRASARTAFTYERPTLSCTCTRAPVKRRAGHAPIHVYISVPVYVSASRRSQQTLNLYH